LARGNRRWGRILLILLLLVVIVVFAADRIGVVVAEGELAKQARSHLAAENITTSGEPKVTIGGFPFLTQVAAGEYHDITIKIADPTSKGIRIDSLDVTATDVNAPLHTVIGGDGSIVADRVDGTAHISWDSFQQMVDLSGVRQYGIDPSRLHISGSDGKITLSTPVTLLGRTFDLEASGTVTVSNEILHVKITDIRASNTSLPSLVQGQLQTLESKLAFDVRIPDLPYSLHIDSVSTTDAGVAISASATNVTLGS